VGTGRPKAKLIDSCRTWAALACTEALIPPLVHAVVEFTWFVPDRKRRDEDNPVATMKPICDGIVDAGVVPDDTPDLMTKMWPILCYRKGQGGFSVRITGEEADLAESLDSVDLTGGIA
jgi:hypothetical protein